MSNSPALRTLRSSSLSAQPSLCSCIILESDFQSLFSTKFLLFEHEIVTSRMKQPKAAEQPTFQFAPFPFIRRSNRTLASQSNSISAWHELSCGRRIMPAKLVARGDAVILQRTLRAPAPEPPCSHHA